MPNRNALSSHGKTQGNCKCKLSGRSESEKAARCGLSALGPAGHGRRIPGRQGLGVRRRSTGLPGRENRLCDTMMVMDMCRCAFVQARGVRSAEREPRGSVWARRADVSLWVHRLTESPLRGAMMMTGAAAPGWTWGRWVWKLHAPYSQTCREPKTALKK